MRLTLAVILSLSTIASTVVSAETRKERNARIDAEWQKFENNAANVCGEGGVLQFNYSPLDRRTYEPVFFSAALEPDLMKRVAAALKLKDETGNATLTGPFNDAVNARMEELRNGTYNILNVLMKKGRGPSFAITPGIDGTVLIWIYAGAFDRFLDLAGGTGPRDGVNVLSADGTIAYIDKATRPKWLQSEDFLEQASGSYGAIRKREKKYVKCP